MAPEGITEQFFNQVSDSIQLVLDLTSRIDEKVKMIVEKQAETHDRLDKMAENAGNLASRVTILESKDISSLQKDILDVGRRLLTLEAKDIANIQKNQMESDKRMQELVVKVEGLSIKNQGQEAKWKTVIDLSLKLLIAVVGGAILASLHLPSPPVIGP